MTATTLGLRANWRQFALLVAVNALVGAVVGQERAIMPQLAEREFGLTARTAVLSFIVAFGLAKALSNLLAGHWSGRWTRKRVLLAGWAAMAPVPLLMMGATSWAWVVAANVLLGIGQGLAWSTTVIMKIDLAGPRRRGLAMGLNEFAGYLAVGLSALATGWLAGRYGLRPAPFYLGAGLVLLGLLLSILWVRDTSDHAKAEAAGAVHPTAPAPTQLLTPRQVFWRTTAGDPTLAAATQAGLVNNLNDGMAWGLLPVVFGAAHLDLATTSWLAALYPLTWGAGQLATGALSDRWGRKWLIAGGMWLQAAAIAVLALGHDTAIFAAGMVALGAGTAMVYPTLLATVGDAAHPSWRAGAVGAYRFWRDLGYAVGALTAGVVADSLGVAAALWAVAGLTALSGTVAAVRMAARPDTARHGLPFAKTALAVAGKS